MTDIEVLNLEALESRLEMEAFAGEALQTWVPIECWCDNR